MVGTRSSTRPNPSEPTHGGSPPPAPAKRGRRTGYNATKANSRKAAVAEKDTPDVDMLDASAGEAPATVKESGTPSFNHH